MSLTKQQQKYLRIRSHELKPVVWLGQNGLTDNVLKEIESALIKHELIKIKLRLDNRVTKDKLIEDICKQTEAEHVQLVGNIASIYRRNEKQPVLVLPV